jgi:hypothetical protein
MLLTYRRIGFNGLVYNNLETQGYSSLLPVIKEVQKYNEINHGKLCLIPL